MAESAWATGWTAAAAVLMIFGGIMAVFAGIAAIAEDDVFIATPNFSYEFSLTGWGWLHLILGIVVALAGFALLSGAVWARAVGIVLAGLSMVANFAWLPYAPVWSIVLIVVDGFVIWALCAPRREIPT
jgi:succinate-acetate transporter protein